MPVGATFGRPGIRRIPSTARWINTGTFRANVVIGPYSHTVRTTVGADAHIRPGIRRIPSTARWINAGTFRAVTDRPYGGVAGFSRISYPYRSCP